MKLKHFENKQHQKLNKFILQIVVVSFASFVGGLAFKNFFEAAGIIPTGLSGLSMIICNALGSAGVNLPTAVVYLIINAFLFAFAFKIFGWRFLVLSAFGIGFYTLAMQFGVIPAIYNHADDTLLYAVVGSILGGLSVGVAMKFGGTTGGSDIAGIIINRYFPKIKTGYCLLMINIVVLILSVVSTGAISTGLYALIVAVVNALTNNLVLDGSKRVVAYYIICDKDEEIAVAILEKYHRGVTRLEAKGMFSKKDKSMLLCVVPQAQTHEFKSIVNKIDSNAFIFSAPVTETMGDGNFLKEYSIFKNKIKKSKNNLKNNVKYSRHENIKKLKLKGKQKRFRNIEIKPINNAENKEEKIENKKNNKK